MPIYEYRCENCKEEFEKLVLGSEEGISCPSCNGTRVKRLMSVAAFKSGDTFVSSASSGGCAGCSSTSCSTCK
jgi:putative FmdB family regulatory protein